VRSIAAGIERRRGPRQYAVGLVVALERQQCGAAQHQRPTAKPRIPGGLRQLQGLGGVGEGRLVQPIGDPSDPP
jgi:hypothetical protein